MYGTIHMQDAGGMCNKLLNLINAEGVQQTILEHYYSKRGLVAFIFFFSSKKKNLFFCVVLSFVFCLHRLRTVCTAYCKQVHEISRKENIFCLSVLDAVIVASFLSF